MGSNMREDIIDLDLNLEPLFPPRPVGSMVGLGTLINELETAQVRIEERIRQLEAVTFRARQRQRWRQGQTNPQILNITVEPTMANLARGEEVGVLTREVGADSREMIIENGKSGKMDSTHLIAKALAMDMDTKKTETDGAGFFDCNICLDMAKEPVLTCCGHLFCWPCFYQVSYAYSNVKECPVCKGEVTNKSIVPIYGNGNNSSPGKSKSKEVCLKIPPRPQAPRIESVRQQIINRGAFSSPVEVRISNLIGAMGERTRDVARITGERTSSLASRYRASQVFPTTEAASNVIHAVGEGTRFQDLDGTRITSERTNSLANRFDTSRVLPTTEADGNQQNQSLQFSRLLMEGAASFSSLSSALDSAMHSAERLVEEFINTRPAARGGRSQHQSSHVDRDAISRIAADFQPETHQGFGFDGLIDSVVTPSASLFFRNDVPPVVDLENQTTTDAAIEVDFNGPSSSSTRRSTVAPRVSDIDHGDTHERRRRRLR